MKDVFGSALLDAQYGDHPDGAKPFGEGVPSAVMKLVEDHDGETYRAAYTAHFKKCIYVLHVFQKKSKSGIATPREDIALVKTRYQSAKEHYEKHFEKGSTNE